MVEDDKLDAGAETTGALAERAFVSTARDGAGKGQDYSFDPTIKYAIGTSEYPDRSATLIVESTALLASGATLRGPGIDSQAALSLPEVTAFQSNHALFPLGLDFIFTSGNDIAALPRSTEVI